MLAPLKGVPYVGVSVATLGKVSRVSLEGALQMDDRRTFPALAATVLPVDRSARSLSDAFINKGTAYTDDERRLLGFEVCCRRR